MFLTVDAAHAALTERFSGHLVEVFMSLLAPAILLQPTDVESSMATTRIGGQPAMSDQIEWPTPPPHPDIDGFLNRFVEDARPNIEERLRNPLPYAFVAQIELSELACCGEVAADLPHDGRLLFFYNFDLGYYDVGNWSGHVIWDRGPAEALHLRAMPASLQAAEEKAAADFEAKYGSKGFNNVNTAGVYQGVSSRQHPVIAYQFPSAVLSEVFSTPQLQDGTWMEDYSELTLPSGLSFLLGRPIPEGDDPRMFAAFTKQYGEQPPSFANVLNHEIWETKGDDLGQEAREWRLLLQIREALLFQDGRSGTIYFLIREEDLKSRDFNKVVTVYQAS